MENRILKHVSKVLVFESSVLPVTPTYPKDMPHQANESRRPSSLYMVQYKDALRLVRSRITESLVISWK